MIKITYTITFDTPGGASVCFSLPPELDAKVAEFRSMAADLGCTVDLAANEDQSVVTVVHNWPEQNLLDIFLSVADYADFMTAYNAFIADAGGTVTRVQEEV